MRRQVHDRFHFVFQQRSFQAAFVAEVTLNKWRVRSHCIAMPPAEIVINYGMVPGGEQFLDEHASDVASSAGDEYTHWRSLAAASSCAEETQGRLNGRVTFSLRD